MRTINVELHFQKLYCDSPLGMILMPFPFPFSSLRFRCLL